MKRDKIKTWTIKVIRN